MEYLLWHKSCCIFGHSNSFYIVCIDGLSPLCMNVPFPLFSNSVAPSEIKGHFFFYFFSILVRAIKKANLTLENEKPLKGSLNFKGILVDRFHVVIHELEFGWKVEWASMKIHQFQINSRQRPSDALSGWTYVDVFKKGTTMSRKLKD